MRYFVVLLLVLLSTAFIEEASAEIQLQGNLTQGGLVSGQANPGSRVFLDDRPVSVSSEGDFILGFGRDAEHSYQLKIIDGNGDTSEQKIEVAPRHYQIERINGISKQMMHPSAAELKRIGAEARLVRSARTTVSPLTNFKEPFTWPLHGRISGVYGSQRIFNGEPRRPHFGIDIAAPDGTTIKAPAGGIVTLAHQGMFYSGQTLIIDHGLGLSSTFLHLSSILVKVGDKVRRGTPIAKVGATGRVTGPHLDWRINWLQERLDPALLVPEMPILE